MPRIADLKRAFQDTKLNLEVAIEDPLHMDPIVCQWLVYDLRRKNDPSIKLEDVTYFEHAELMEAITAFFQRPSPPSVASSNGSPESTSDSADSVGPRATSTTQT